MGLGVLEGPLTVLKFKPVWNTVKMLAQIDVIDMIRMGQQYAPGELSLLGQSSSN